MDSDTPIKTSIPDKLYFKMGEVSALSGLPTYVLRFWETEFSKTSERIEFEMQQELNADMIYFNPFLTRFFDKIPFTLEKRNYPVDFGYQRHQNYL